MNKRKPKVEPCSWYVSDPPVELGTMASDAQLLLDHAHDLITWGEYDRLGEALQAAHDACGAIDWLWMRIWDALESVSGCTQSAAIDAQGRTAVLNALCRARELV